MLIYFLNVYEELRLIFYRHGPPKILRCDNGTEFKGEVKALCEEFGVKMVRGRSYHPQTQGKVSIRFFFIFVASPKQKCTLNR